jgi:hypothetical protein
MVMLSHDTYILPLSSLRPNVTGGATAQLIVRARVSSPVMEGYNRCFRDPASGRGTRLMSAGWPCLPSASFSKKHQD